MSNIDYVIAIGGVCAFVFCIGRIIVDFIIDRK